MYEEKAEIIFPEENEHLLKEELFWKINLLLKFRRFDDGRKYIWFSAIVLKAFIAVSVTIFAYKVKNEPDKLAACVATCPAILMAVFKLFYMYFQSEGIKYLFDVINQEFWDLGIAGSLVKKRIMRRFLLINLTLTSQICLSFVCIYILNVYPLMEMPKGVKRLPNPVWTPFDTNVSPLYEILYFLLVCSQVLTVFGNGYYDFAYGSATQHLCAQLLLLKEQLKNITVGIMPHASDLEKFNSRYFQKRVMERLKICVRHHCRLLKYGKNLDRNSSSVLLLQLLMSYLAMVINGYILTSNKAGTLQTVEICSYTMTIFTEFVVFSVQASDLKDQSITVVDAVALSEWYLFKAPIKKALALLTMNAEKSIVITVGGMIEADNSLIIEVVLKAFSAITLLKALTIEEGQ